MKRLVAIAGLLLATTAGAAVLAPTSSRGGEPEPTYKPVNPDNLKVPACHGYSEGGHWHLHALDFSLDELNFANNVALSIKSIDPENKDEQIDMLVILDQFACKGVPYVETFRNIERMTRAAVDLRKPDSDTRKRLLDDARHGVDVGTHDDGKL